jgi:recombination protein RecA
MAIEKEKKKALDAMMGKIRKKYGSESIDTVGNVQEKLKQRYLKTPSVEFNQMLYGGVCEGRIVEFFGPQSSGKTSMAIEIIAYQQKLDPNFVAGWLETESSVTPEILAAHGVDMDRLVYWGQEEVGNAENALDIYRSIVSSGQVNLLVVNSIAGLAPKTEMEEDLTKQQMALVARLLSKFFRVTLGSAAKNRVTQIFINQIRATMNQYRPEATTGGLALAFYASQRVRMSKVSMDSKDPITKEEGVKISCIVHKNRFAGMKNPFTAGSYYARYDTGIDSSVNLPTFLEEAGIVRQSGAYWYYEDENKKPLVINGMLCKFASRGEFLSALRSNKVLNDELVAKLEQYNAGATTIRQLTPEEIAEIENENSQIEKEMAQIDREEAGAEIEELFDEQP